MEPLGSSSASQCGPPAPCCPAGAKHTHTQNQNRTGPQLIIKPSHGTRQVCFAAPRWIRSLEEGGASAPGPLSCCQGCADGWDRGWSLFLPGLCLLPYNDQEGVWLHVAAGWAWTWLWSPRASVFFVMGQFEKEVVKSGSGLTYSSTFAGQGLVVTRWPPQVDACVLAEPGRKQGRAGSFFSGKMSCR